MSQITIVDDVLNFTEIDTAPDDSSHTTAVDHRDTANRRARPDDALSDEEQRISRELTAIRITGRLPE